MKKLIVAGVGLLAAVAATIIVAAALSGPSFAEEDPIGHQACTLFAEARTTEDLDASVGGFFDASRLAMDAQTEEIRATVEESAADRVDLFIETGVDLPLMADGLEDVCPALGVDIPDRPNFEE